MRVQTLSSYRLKSKAVSINKTFIADNGIAFSIFVSKGTGSVSQYYIIESKWENAPSPKVIPLAHLQVSKISGNIKFAAFQPENWNLKTDSFEFVRVLSRFIPEISKSHNISVAH